MAEPEDGAAREPLEVADAAQQPAQDVPHLRRVRQRLHRVLPRADGVGIEQRAQQPLAKEPRAHRRHRLVEHAEERVARAAVAGVEQLERLHGRRVEGERVSGVQPLQPREVPELLALRRPQVGEGAGRRLHADRELADTERLEARHAEVRAEIAGGPAPSERGGIAEAQRRAVRGEVPEQVARVAQRVRQHDLGWPAEQRGRQHAVVARGVLARPELAGRHVDERHARALATAHDGEQEVVRAAREVRGVGHGAGRDHADHVAPQELLALAGGFHLLADRDLLAGLHEPRDVGLGRVMGDAGHRRALPRGQRDGEQARALLGVVEEQLVEVAEPEQQQVVGIAALQLPVLRHHRRR